MGGWSCPVGGTFKKHVKIEWIIRRQQGFNRDDNKSTLIHANNSCIYRQK